MKLSDKEFKVLSHIYRYPRIDVSFIASMLNIKEREELEGILQCLYTEECIEKSPLRILEKGRMALVDNLQPGRYVFLDGKSCKVCSVDTPGMVDLMVEDDGEEIRIISKKLAIPSYYRGEKGK